MRVEILAKEITKKDGETFTAFKAFTKQGKIDLRFTKTCELVPTNSCFIHVLEENMNVNEKGRYPILYVTKVESIEEYPESNSKIEKYFGE